MTVDPTASPIAIEREAATRYARAVSYGLLDGTVSLTTGDDAIAWLTDMGHHEQASAVRLAAETRRATLRARGFSRLGGGR